MRFKTKYWSRITVFSIAAITVACGTSETVEEAPIQALELTNMDSTVRPADDFFKFVNGKWIERTEIPEVWGSYGAPHKLYEDNNEIVLDLLESAVESGDYEEGTDQYKASVFYSVGMDSALAETTGLQPLKLYFDKIDALSDIDDLQEYLSELEMIGGGRFFNFYVGTDLKKSNEVTTYLSQGGLGLPDRDYYTREDARSVEIREKYLKHVARMLQFTGVSAEESENQAARIMKLETQLAEASMTNVERRDTESQYNKYAISDLSRLVPSFSWNKYLADMEIEGIDSIIVRQPKYMEACEAIFSNTAMSEIKEYLVWGAINNNANYLNNEIVQADFDFYRTELRGVSKMRARWKRVLGTTNSVLGEAIGKLYVDATFPPEAKLKAKEMVENIKLAYAGRIKNLDWMSDSTKEKALEKLEKMVVKIGYPDKWRDYAALKVDNDPEASSFMENILNARKFGFKYQAAKLGKPVDRTEWAMSPQTVNAYFNPTKNEIVFPAAILQPPFYNYKADEAVNYGGIGSVIGHEISHCFDDQGSKYDADGNLRNWWTDEDAENFKARTAKLVDQFNNYEPLDSAFVNGSLTLGENIGDLGGINAAYDALQRYYAENGRPEDIEGLTAEQRFFIGHGAIWRIKYKDETLRVQMNTDTHSPNMYRVNGALSNHPAFYEVFGVKEGDQMYRPDSLRVDIW